jgi:hypothetical protein
VHTPNQAGPSSSSRVFLPNSNESLAADQISAFLSQSLAQQHEQLRLDMIALTQAFQISLGGLTERVMGEFESQKTFNNHITQQLSALPPGSLPHDRRDQIPADDSTAPPPLSEPSQGPARRSGRTRERDPYQNHPSHGLFLVWLSHLRSRDMI